MDCQGIYNSRSHGVTALKILRNTKHQKVDEQHISLKHCKFSSFAVISAMVNYQSSYYSVSYQATVLKICHNTYLQ